MTRAATLLMLVIAMQFFACLSAKHPIEIVIPRGCIDSDIVCQVHGKTMTCHFEKFAKCETIHVSKGGK